MFCVFCLFDVISVLGNIDQSMYYALLKYSTGWVPDDVASAAGKSSRQGDRNTITVTSGLYYYFQQEKTQIAPNYIILESVRKDVPYPGMSTRMEHMLNAINLEK